MYSANVSTVNVDNVADSFSEGTQQVENDMNAMVAKIQTQANPSQSDLMALQTITIRWQSMIQAESSVIKVMGDVMKQVVSNIGA